MSLFSIFTRQIKKFILKTDTKLEYIHQTAIIEMLGRVIDDTPVYTGLLVNNWQASIGAPATGIIQAVDPSGQNAYDSMVNVAKTADINDVVLFTNNLPYFDKIEYESYSSKAPGGMLRKNLQDWSAIVAEVTANARGI